jgi:hypothetical protein
MFPILFNYLIKEEIKQLRAANCVSMVISLPWPMVEAHERQAQRNHSQSVARLAERGGLAPCEACAVLEDREWHSMPLAVAHAQLKELFSAWQREQNNPRDVLRDFKGHEGGWGSHPETARKTDV